jgi:hypothetical protein
MDEPVTDRRRLRRAALLESIQSTRESRCMIRNAYPLFLPLFIQIDPEPGFLPPDLFRLTFTKSSR